MHQTTLCGRVLFGTTIESKLYVGPDKPLNRVKVRITSVENKYNETTNITRTQTVVRQRLVHCIALMSIVWKCSVLYPDVLLHDSRQ